MRKVFGITGLLLVVFTATALQKPQFVSAYNLQNLIHWTALFGIISIGAAFVIMTGGIDLSIGSVIGLVGSLLAWLLTQRGWSVPGTVAASMTVAVAIGFAHGLLITKVRLQPFVVTLCGLLLYRGIARYVTKDESLGFGNTFEGLRQLATGKIALTSQFSLTMPVMILAVIAVVAAVVLNRAVWGRHLMAVGRNETAARFSGINTDAVKIAAYVICATLAGVGGVLFSLDLNSVQPSGLGEFYELYAIAAAVLGGCSLRGGEGTIIGVIVGTAVMRVLYNAINILEIPTHVEFAIIGAVILAGVTTDEVVKRIADRRRALREAME
ncbi:MAG: ABC transporter permease [Verrucomicrobia bacterium]|nr:ABC transporter permease [Verrucomicrobiota bacterium]